LISSHLFFSLPPLSPKEGEGRKKRKKLRTGPNVSGSRMRLPGFPDRIPELKTDETLAVSLLSFD
jgi:hypothetical protein